MENSLNKFFCYEDIYKVLKYDSKIEIYVKTAFIETIYPLTIAIYKDYDFKSEKFINKLGEEEETIVQDEYIEYSNNYQFYNNSLAKYTNHVDTYVYTFEQDSTDGEYYLSAFSKVE